MADPGSKSVEGGELIDAPKIEGYPHATPSEIEDGGL